MKPIITLVLLVSFIQGMGENRQLYIITDSKQVAEAEKASVTIPEDVVWIFDSFENTIKVCTDSDTTELNVLEFQNTQATCANGDIIHYYPTDFGTIIVNSTPDNITVLWIIGNRTYRFYNN